MPIPITLAPVARPVALDGVELAASLSETARQIRIQDLTMVRHAGAGHIGGDFSAIDILTVLHGAVLDIAPDQADDPDRDRFILSKGHVAGAYYATLAAYGFLPVAQLATFLQPGTALGGHPDRQAVPAVEANTGPLGHGLPIGVGLAIAARLTERPYRVFVLVGDGELQEGSNWEAMITAAHHRLSNLTVIVDRNRLQQGARVEDTSGLEPLADKATAFGWQAITVDGHDHGQLVEVLSGPPMDGRPRFVIAETHKGHPISYMSDNVAWHHKVPDSDEFATALDELGAQVERIPT